MYIITGNIEINSNDSSPALTVTSSVQSNKKTDLTGRYLRLWNGNTATIQLDNSTSSGIIKVTDNTNSESSTMNPSYVLTPEVRVGSDIYINNINIFDMGTSGIWTYMKFANGFAVCYGVYELTVSINNSWGSNGYASGNITLPDFPFTFTSTPTVTMSTVNTSTTDGYMAFVGNAGAANSYPTTTYPGKVALFRGSSVTSKAFAISIIAMGKWN